MNQRIRHPAIAICITIAALTGLVLSGCSGGGSVFQPTITRQQATDRVEQILRSTADGITPRPRLEVYKPGSVDGPCMADPSNTADTRIQVVRSYWLRGISTHDNITIGEQILRMWKKNGYGISDTPGIGTDAPNIHAVTQDDFLISLEWSDNGALSIGASSPCLWPDGTPPPSH